MTSPDVVDGRTVLERLTTSIRADTAPAMTALLDQAQASTVDQLTAHDIDPTDPAQARAVIAGFCLGMHAWYARSFQMWAAGLLAVTVDHRQAGTDA